jgi:hypothetical protein
VSKVEADCRRGLTLCLLLPGYAPGNRGSCCDRCAKGIETPLNVRLPAVLEPTLFDISPN